MSDPNTLRNRSAKLSGGTDGRLSVQTTTYTGVDGTRKKGTTYWDRRRQDYRNAYYARRDAAARTRDREERRERQTAAARIDELNRGYQGTNRQLYRDYMQQQRILPQQMAVQGYTGGLTESSRLRLGNAYEEALNSNEQARLSAQADINESLDQQLYETRAAAAAASAEARQRYYDQVSDLNERRHQQQREDLERRAATMAASGDFSLYRKLGYSDREIAYLKKMYRRQHPELFRNR